VCVRARAAYANVNRPALVAGLLTVLTTANTSTVPASCFGVTAVHSTLDAQLTFFAAVVPNLNTVAPVPGLNPER
jgi:hypothetical protein